MLRRGDGASLTGDVALANQGVRDGDVLYLVPRNLAWPEPEYDDVVEEIAAGARAHGRLWDAAATRLFALVAAGLVLLTGLGVLVAARTGPYGARAWWRLRSAAGAAGRRRAAVPRARRWRRRRGHGRARPAVRRGQRSAAACRCRHRADRAGRGQCAAARLGHRRRRRWARAADLHGRDHGGAVRRARGGARPGGVPGRCAASIVLVALVAGVGLAPLLAVRLGKVPFPVVSAVPEVIAAEHRPDRSAVRASAVRADEMLAGSLLGIALTAVGCVGRPRRSAAAWPVRCWPGSPRSPCCCGRGCSRASPPACHCWPAGWSGSP